MQDKNIFQHILMFVETFFFYFYGIFCWKYGYTQIFLFCIVKRLVSRAWYKGRSLHVLMQYFSMFYFFLYFFCFIFFCWISTSLNECFSLYFQLKTVITSVGKKISIHKSWIFIVIKKENIYGIECKISKTIAASERVCRSVFLAIYKWLGENLVNKKTKKTEHKF